jgi:hypothetical protein
MENSKRAHLREENKELRELVIQLSKILLRTLAEIGELPIIQNRSVRWAFPEPMSQAEIVAGLREEPMRCARLSRDSADSGAAQELGSLSVELADTAERVQNLLNPSGNEQGDFR